MSALPPKADIGTGTCITFDAATPAASIFAAIRRASLRVSGLAAGRATSADIPDMLHGVRAVTRIYVRIGPSRRS